MRRIDIEINIGDRFGFWTVIGEEEKDHRGCIVYPVMCDCQQYVDEPDRTVHMISRSNLANGKSLSCGCHRKSRQIVPGDRFGMLVAVKLMPQKKYERSKWLFKCDCGNEKIILENSILTGKTRSCGCLQTKVAKNRAGHNLKCNKYRKTKNYMIGYTDNGEKFTFDFCDYELVKKYKWYEDPGNYIKTRGRFMSDNYMAGKQSSFGIHNLIMGIEKPSDNMMVDHIDGNKKNNRRNNLRIATKSQNNWNAKLRKDNTSGAKGVSFDKNKNKWVVQIMKDKKQNRIGLFDSFEEARSVAEIERKKMHGEFARNE